MNAPTPKITRDDGNQIFMSMVGGVLIWFLHLNVVYGLTSLACKWGWFPFKLAGLSGLAIVQLGITLIAAALILITVYLPWRKWRQYQLDKERLFQHTEGDRRPLIAFVSMGLNLFFLLFIIAAFIVIVSFNACG
jgi:hypothetical protein